MKTSRTSLLLLLATLLPGTLAAHGVVVSVDPQQTNVVLRAFYDGGGPFAGEVRLYSPKDPDKVFLEGNSDPNGFFAFVPSTPGVWVVDFDDGMGHRETVDVEVDEANIPELPKHSTTWQPILIGLVGAGLGFFVGRVRKPA